ncbi:MAG: glycosyltransferase family 4 protein [Thermodesulfovibrionia bacterium]|nr:glycosyltransferase family 4 protein [Thermodesulfovibrionia bacterium]
MNILHINNFHYFRGGSESVYFNTAKLLEEHGHHSVFFSTQHPENIPCEMDKYFMPYVDFSARHSIIDQLKIAGRVIYSLEAKKRLTRLIEEYPVDVAHLHNIYHVFSPSILHVLKKKKIPVVMSLHDYKMVCGSYTLLRRHPIYGTVCEECSGGKYYKAVKNKCVKNSFAKSLLTAVEMYLHHKVLDIYKNVDIFICTSKFAKSKLEEMGFKKNFFYLPNFIDTKKLSAFNFAAGKIEKSKAVLYIGRHVPEKGLWTLLDAAGILYKKNKTIEIKLSGEGPFTEILKAKVKEENIGNVRFLGFLKYEDLCCEIQNSAAVVLPSECHDNNPISVIESFAMSVPVIGARMGGIPELVRDYETGLTFEAGNAQDLSEKIEYVIDNPDKAADWGKMAKKLVEEKLGAEKYYADLMEIYQLASKKAVSYAS